MASLRDSSYPLVSASVCRVNDVLAAAAAVRANLVDLAIIVAVEARRLSLVVDEGTGVVAGADTCVPRL